MCKKNRVHLHDSHAFPFTHKSTKARTHTQTQILLSLSFTSCDAKLTLQTVQDSVWKTPQLLCSPLLYYFHVKPTVTEAGMFCSTENPIDDCTLNSLSLNSICLFSWSFDPLYHCSFTQLPLFTLKLCFQMWKWNEQS